MEHIQQIDWEKLWLIIEPIVLFFVKRIWDSERKTKSQHQIYLLKILRIEMLRELLIAASYIDKVL